MTEELHLTKSQSFLEVGGGLVALFVAFHSNVGEAHGYEFSIKRHRELTKWLKELPMYSELYHLAPHATELAKLKDFDVHSSAANVIFCNTAALSKDVFASVAEQLSELMSPENILVLTTDPWARATRSSPPPFKLYKIKRIDSGLEDVTSETTLFFFQHPEGTRPSELVQVDPDEATDNAANHKNASNPSSPARPKPASPSKTAHRAKVTSPTKVTSPKATSSAKADTTAVAASSTPNKRRRHTEIYPSSSAMDEDVATASPRPRAVRRSLAPSSTHTEAPSTPKRNTKRKEEESTSEAEATSSTPHRTRATSTPSKPKAESATSKVSSPAPKSSMSARLPSTKASSADSRASSVTAPSSPNSRRARSHHTAAAAEEEDHTIVTSPKRRSSMTPSSLTATKKTAARRASVVPESSSSMDVDETAPTKRTRAVKATGTPRRSKAAMDVEDDKSVAHSTPKRAAKASSAPKAATDVKKRTTTARTPAVVDDIDLPAPSNRRKRTRIEATADDATSAESSSDTNVSKPPKREAAAHARASMKAVSDYIETDEEDDFERPKKRVARSPIKSPSRSSSSTSSSSSADSASEAAPSAPASASRPRRAPKRTGAPATRATRTTVRPFTTSNSETEKASQGWFSWLWNWLPGTSSSTDE